MDQNVKTQGFSSFHVEMLWEIKILMETMVERVVSDKEF